MAQFPALPLWTDAYLGDTTHLTTIEHGSYLLLLMAMWRSRTLSLPNDRRLLAKYCRLTTTQWDRIAPVILDFFDEEHGCLVQGRLTDEHYAVEQRSRRQSDKAKARWLKNKTNGHAAALPRQSHGNASHTHTHNTKESKKEIHSGNGNGKHRVKPRHLQKTKDGKRIWLDRGTSDWNKYAAAYAERHAGMAPPTQWNGSGTWFNLATGDA